MPAAEQQKQQQHCGDSESIDVVSLCFILSHNRAYHHAVVVSTFVVTTVEGQFDGRQRSDPRIKSSLPAANVNPALCGQSYNSPADDL